MTERERFLNEMSGKGDGIVTSGVGIGYPVAKDYDNRLDWMESFSKHVGVSIGRSQGEKPGYEWTDIWGCRWRYPISALDGIVIDHPVKEWSDLDHYTGPDPDTFIDWDKAAENVRKQHDEGSIAVGGTDHGGVFLRLTYLRGYEQFMVDVAEQSEELDRLIAIVENFWMEVITRWADIGVDQVSFGDDLGLQDRLPMSPAAWRRVIKPTYQRLYSYCRSRNIYVFMHTDGYIVDIIPDLIECGVTTLNPQELVNGLGNLADLAKGKVYIDLDIDRQHITPYGTPEEIDDHIRNCVETLGSPNGGLKFVWGVYPPTPYENIEACVRAMDKYATMWADKSA
jgi:uroporphyrinogen decarboxylase